MTAGEANPLGPDVLPPMAAGMAPDEYQPKSSREVVDCMDALTPLVQEAEPALRHMGVRPFPLVEIPTETRHTILAYDASKYPGGAFKFAGAAFGLWRLKQEDPDLQRITTGSAGNFALTLKKAGDFMDVQVTAHTPSNINHQRVAALRRAGVDVVCEDYADIVAATLGARKDAARGGSKTAFLHAYNDPYVIRGQRITADYLLQAFLQFAANHNIKLQSQQTELMAQVGGGSWIAALATGTEVLRRQGVFGENVVVSQILPKRLSSGEPDPRYAGLTVPRPGSWPRAIIGDSRFVQGRHKVSPLATGRALVHMEATLGEAGYEPSAVVGLGAALAAGAKATRRTVYVVMLSGRNDPQATRQLSQCWIDAKVRPSETRVSPRAQTPTSAKPRPQPEEAPAWAEPQSQIDREPSPSPSRAPHSQGNDERVRNPGLSGATAGFRQGPYGRNGARYQSDEEATYQEPYPRRAKKTPF